MVSKTEKHTGFYRYAFFHRNKKDSFHLNGKKLSLFHVFNNFLNRLIHV